MNLLLFMAIGSFVVSCGNSKKAAEKEHQAKNEAAVENKFKEIFHEALLEKTIGHYDKAIPMFEQCLNLDPTSSAAHFALSDLYQRQQNFNKAMHHAEEAFKLDKSNKWYSMHLADLHYEIGNFSRCADLYALSIEDEKNIDVKKRYSEVLIYAARHQQAIDILNEIEVEMGKVPEISLTKHDLYLELGDMDKAENELTTLIEDNPSEIENYLIIAEYFINTNYASRAESILEKALTINPKSGDVYVLKADLSLRSGKVKQALDELSIAFDDQDILLDRKLDLVEGLSRFAFDPTNPDGKVLIEGIGKLYDQIYDEDAKNDQLHKLYGMYLQRQRKLKEARHQFELSTQLKPDSFFSWRELMNLDYRLNDFEALETHTEKAIELFPAQPLFYLLSGIGSYHQQHYQKAEEWLYLGKDLVVSDPELSSEFLYHLGKMKCLQKKYDDGISYFQAALDEFPENGKVYNEMTHFLIESGNENQAEEVINEGLSKYPQNALILDAKGNLLMSRKDYSAALKLYENALKNDLSNPDIMEHYGDAMFLTGEEEKAVGLWKDAVFHGATSELIQRKIADQTYYEK